MGNWLERSALLIGEDNIVKLKNAHVLIVGLGGIGSFAGEFIARAGIGTMTTSMVMCLIYQTRTDN